MSKVAMITKAQALTMAPFLMCSVSMVPGLCIAAWAVVMRLQIASIELRCRWRRRKALFASDDGQGAGG